MGKIFLKGRSGGDFSEVSEVGLSVRYLKTSDSFEFKGLRLTKRDTEQELKESGLSLAEIGEGFSMSRVVVKSNVLSAMIMADKMDFCYHWSIGYEAREKLGKRPGDFALMRDRELAFVHKSIDSSSCEMISVDDYLDLSVWQYCYNISETILHQVRVLWKKRKWNRGNVSSCWLELCKRENFGGRMIGARSVPHAGVMVNMESDADFNERISHNKKVAIAKGYLTWYIETCKEEAKRNKVAFDKEKCLETWRLERERI